MHNRIIVYPTKHLSILVQAPLWTLFAPILCTRFGVNLMVLFGTFLVSNISIKALKKRHT